MCRRVACPSCGMASFAGCGQHIEQVLADVPLRDRCSCPPKRGLLARLLGR